MNGILYWGKLKIIQRHIGLWNPTQPLIDDLNSDLCLSMEFRLKQPCHEYPTAFRGGGLTKHLRLVILKRLIRVGLPAPRSLNLKYSWSGVHSNIPVWFDDFEDILNLVTGRTQTLHCHLWLKHEQTMVNSQWDNWCHAYQPQVDL